MRFKFGYAGIPAEIYDRIYSKRAMICGDSGDFISKPIPPFANTGYSSVYADFFLESFHSLVSSDHYNNLRDTGFALIYINYPDVGAMDFVKKFFPFFLCIPVDWSLDSSRNVMVRQSTNQLLNKLRVATQHAKDAIPCVRKEIVEQDSRTPLLLPINNFRSKSLVSELEALQSELANHKDKQRAIVKRVQSIEQKHPRQRDDSGREKRSFFVDERRVEFRPPGRDRHAFARNQEGHPNRCLLSGRRRLGAPYDIAFHYDCTRGEDVLKGEFFGCHEPPSMHKGAPHLNIAPNDYVRP